MGGARPPGMPGTRSRRMTSSIRLMRVPLVEIQHATHIAAAANALIDAFAEHHRREAEKHRKCQSHYPDRDALRLGWLGRKRRGLHEAQLVAAAAGNGRAGELGVHLALLQLVVLRMRQLQIARESLVLALHLRSRLHTVLHLLELGAQLALAPLQA